MPEAMNVPLRRNRPFVVLVAAHAITRLGFWIAFLSLMSLASFTFRGSPAALAVLWSGFSIPFIVLAPFAGALVDRSSPKRVLIGAFIVQAAVCLGLIWATTMWELFLAGILWATVGTLLQPAFGAMLKIMVSPDRLRGANGVIQAGWEATLIVGPALGGLLFRVFGTRVPFLVSIAFYAVGFVVAVFIPRTSPAPRHEAVRIGAELREGLVVLFRRRELKTLTAWGALGGSGLGVLIALEPVFVRQVLGGGAARLGIIYSLSGIGSTAGALGVGYLRRVRRELLVAGCALALAGLGMAAYIGIGKWPAVMPPILVLGLGFASYQALGQTIVQRHSEHSVVGRVTAARRGIDESVMLIGTLASGALAGVAGVRTTLLGGAAVVTIAGMALSVHARAPHRVGAAQAEPVADTRLTSGIAEPVVPVPPTGWGER